MIEIKTLANGLMTADVTASGMVIIDLCDDMRLIFHQHEWRRMVGDVENLMPKSAAEAKP